MRNIYKLYCIISSTMTCWQFWCPMSSVKFWHDPWEKSNRGTRFYLKWRDDWKCTLSARYMHHSEYIDFFSPNPLKNVPQAWIITAYRFVNICNCASPLKYHPGPKAACLRTCLLLPSASTLLTCKQFMRALSIFHGVQMDVSCHDRKKRKRQSCKHQERGSWQTPRQRKWMQVKLKQERRNCDVVFYNIRITHTKKKIRNLRMKWSPSQCFLFSSCRLFPCLSVNFSFCHHS